MNRKEKNRERNKLVVATATTELETSLPAFAEAASAGATSLEEMRKALEILSKTMSGGFLDGFTEEVQQQYAFTTWKRFLDMQPERLQRLTHITQESLFTPTGMQTIEHVPRPNSLYALTHKPGAIFQAAPNEWYCESGSHSDKEGSGYLVTRMFVSHIKEFRWFCTCIQGKKNMYSDRPYCKHMFAVADYNMQRGRIHEWVKFPYLLDVIDWLQHCHEMEWFDGEDFDFVEYHEAINTNKL